MNAAESVVVGIDGSKAAIRAALWAIDEAVSRDVPLRLLYAIEEGRGRDSIDIAGERAAAQTALRHAVAAIDATARPVKIETEITRGSPIRSLLRESAAAAMVCVGAVGLRHFERGRVGSTAAALAVSARCPVAIIRGRDSCRRRPAHGIIVELDGSGDCGVLLRVAAEQARLRNAEIQAIVCGPNAIRGDVDRRLAPWRRRYPDLGVKSVVVHRSVLDYLADNGQPVPLVVVGAHDRLRLAELVGPNGSAVLQEVAGSLLIVNRQHL